MQDTSDIDGDIAQRLTEKLHAWKKEVGAQEPTQNEDYDPETAWGGPAKKGKKK
jgi:hypothetical protein